RLHRGVKDVEHDDGRKDELQIGVGNDEPGFAVDLAAEVRIEADAEQDHPQDRPAESADQLPAIAQRALHLTQPDRIKRANLPHGSSLALLGVLAATPAERISPLAPSGRLVAQLASGERQEHAFKAWAVDREAPQPTAER